MTTVRGYHHRDLDIDGAGQIYQKLISPTLNDVKYVNRSGFIAQMPPKSTAVPDRHAKASGTSNTSKRNQGPRALGTTQQGRVVSSKDYNTPRNQVPVPAARNSSNVTQTVTNGGTSKSTARSQTSYSPLHTSRSMERYLNSIPVERLVESSPQWNLGPQGMRLAREKTQLDNSRSMKRTSQIVKHRIDKMYFMNGSAVKLQSKYEVDDEDVKHIQDLSMSMKQEKDAMKRFPLIYKYDEDEDVVTAKDEQPKHNEPVDFRDVWAKAGNTTPVDDVEKKEDDKSKESDKEITPINDDQQGSAMRENVGDINVFITRKNSGEINPIEQKTAGKDSNSVANSVSVGEQQVDEQEVAQNVDPSGSQCDSNNHLTVDDKSDGMRPKTN